MPRKGSGRYTSPSPAGSCHAEPDAVRAWRAEAEVYDSGEDTDGTSVEASAIQKMKKKMVAVDLLPEEQQTMTTLVLRQCSHYHVLI